MQIEETTTRGQGMKIIKAFLVKIAFHLCLIATISMLSVFLFSGIGYKITFLWITLSVLGLLLFCVVATLPSTVAKPDECHTAQSNRSPYPNQEVRNNIFHTWYRKLMGNTPIQPSVGSDKNIQNIRNQQECTNNHSSHAPTLPQEKDENNQKRT